MKGGENINTGLVIKNLSKAFQNRKVLEGLSVEAANGSRTLLVGPSGAGKSTLLRIIAGLDLPDAGEVYLEGELASTNKWSLEPQKRNIGFVFQNPTLWPHMTIKENIRFGLSKLPKTEASDRVGELMAKARISHVIEKYPDQISGGEAKRAALIRSIAPCPRFLLVDEPFANLDEATKIILLDFMLALVDEFRMTLLYVTHDADEAARVGGTVLQIPAQSDGWT